MSRRRTSFEILASILKHTALEPLNISRIIQVENLSYREARKYLNSLLSAGLIRSLQNGRSEAYSPTVRGHAYVAYFTQLVRMLRGNEGFIELDIISMKPTPSPGLDNMNSEGARKVVPDIGARVLA